MDLCHSWGAYRQALQNEAHRLVRILKKESNKKEKQPIRRMRQIVEQEYKNELTLDYIADQCGFSPTYVSRLFKKEWGMNFLQYLNAVRLDNAKKLLLSTSLTTAQVAAECGYNDEKYFMRLFKKEVGLTAGEYRRLYGG